MIIGFTGYAGSGKDEAARVLVEEYGFTRIAFADKMRAALYALNPIVNCQCDGTDFFTLQDAVKDYGWDDAKRKFPEIRILLQRLGTEVGREMFGENFWVDLAIKKAAPFKNVVFTDCRFVNEADAIQSLGGKVIRITRPGVKPVNEHVSDKGLPDDVIDGEIVNDGTLEDLRAKVAALL